MRAAGSVRQNPALLQSRAGPAQPKLRNPWAVEEDLGLLPCHGQVRRLPCPLGVVRKGSSVKHWAPRAWKQPRHKPGVPVCWHCKPPLSKGSVGEREAERKKYRKEGGWGWWPGRKLLICWFQGLCKFQTYSGELRSWAVRGSASMGRKMDACGFGVLLQTVIYCQHLLCQPRHSSELCMYSCHTALKVWWCLRGSDSRAQTCGHHSHINCVCLFHTEKGPICFVCFVRLHGEWASIFKQMNFFFLLVNNIFTTRET